MSDTGYEWYDENLLPQLEDETKLLVATIMGPEDVVYSSYRIENWSPATTGGDRMRAAVYAQLAALKREEVEKDG